MPRALRPALPSWPALAAAAIGGILEWLALSRSRRHDRFAGVRKSE